MAGVTEDHPLSQLPVEEVAMRASIFGLSTTPVTDIKSELRLQLERDLLALFYRTPR